MSISKILPLVLCKCSTFDNWIRKSNDFLKNSITLLIIFKTYLYRIRTYQIQRHNFLWNPLRWHTIWPWNWMDQHSPSFAFHRFSNHWDNFVEMLAQDSVQCEEIQGICPKLRELLEIWSIYRLVLLSVICDCDNCLLRFFIYYQHKIQNQGLCNFSTFLVIITTFPYLPAAT